MVVSRATRMGWPFALFAALLLAAPISCRGQATFPDGPIAEAASRLKPGEYFWAPQVSPEGPMLLIVNRTTQRAVLYRNGVPVAVTTVSTGRSGHRTPTGIFTVLEKQKVHFSSLYDDAPMPFMQRLTWGGVALHGGQLPGYPASHGCIRLPHGFAQLLYEVTTLGMSVLIVDADALPRLAPIDAPFGYSSGAVVTSELDWHPERAPQGPVSIVVSAADHKVVVLRNGRRIGSATVRIDRPVSGTTALLLQPRPGGGSQWLAVSATGSDAPISSDYWRAFHVDAGFAGAVAAIVRPGTTIVVTADSLKIGPAQSQEVLADEPRR